jgi:UDP-2-acetamido-2,6-beta-L-arabino-hexul-4-ose reductase
MTATGSQIALTGAGGFLGFHIRAHALAERIEISPIGLGSKFNVDEAQRAVTGSTRLIHVAGVNRGTDKEVEEGNIAFARQLSEVVRASASPPRTIVFANSIQVRTDSVYGRAKSIAGEILQEAAEAAGSQFVDLELPNLFGEHGVPFYNSVVATFCHLLASDGGKPQVLEDRGLQLLHAGIAAEVLLGFQAAAAIAEHQVERTVQELLEDLIRLSGTYAGGDIPEFGSRYDRDLFNTYRSYLPAERRVVTLEPKSDSRGNFFEVVKNRGSGGQTSFSTTLPGITRGQHFHLNKIERFAVVAGEATITMRRLFGEEVETFRVSGSNPCAVDMPTLWAHEITNTGKTPLLTMFWINEIFDPSSPDTFPEEV